MAVVVRIPSEVAAVLRYYVYALRDPRDGRVFYIGKGIGDRINAHVREAGKDPESERAKLNTINDIEAAGLEVDLLLLRTGIEDEATSLVVEQAVIDGFAADGHPLTNLVRGHHSGSAGLATLPATVARHRALPCPPIDAPVIMVKIQSGWRPDSTDQQIFEQTAAIGASPRGCATGRSSVSASPTGSCARHTGLRTGSLPNSLGIRARIVGASTEHLPPSSNTSSALMFAMCLAGV